MHPIITIFCAFTRRWALELWLENLAGVEHDPALTNLCIIVDGDEGYIAQAFQALAKNKGYRSFHVKINEDWHVNETKLAVRRMRVADIKTQSKDLVAKTDGDIILGFEDDTVFDQLQSFMPLYKPLDDPTVGFVEGVQVGRWGANIVGVWEADNIDNPKEVKTMLPPTEDYEGYTVDGTKYQHITGGGFYGYATRRELYLQHEYYTSSGQPWGPDVNFGFWVRSQGYKCLVNWGIIFGHNDHGHIWYPNNLPNKQRLVQVVYNKNELGRWERTDHEQGRY